MRRWIFGSIGLVLLAVIALAVSARSGMFAISLEDLRAKYQEPSSRYVRIDGVELHIMDDGPRDAPVLMLVHGHFQSARIWDSWVRRMKGRVRVIRFDMPPYGLSGPDPSGAYSPQRVEQLIAGIAAHYRLKTFAIGGISTGSAVSMRYALAHPDQIEGLVLVNSPLVPIPPKLQPKSPWYMAQLENWVFRPVYRPRAFYSYLLHRLIADPAKVTPQLIDETYDMHRKPGNAQALDRFTSSLRFEARDYGQRSRKTRGQLADVRVPTLILWGGAGSMLPMSVACRVQATITKAPTRLIAYPGAGHFLPLEAPRAAGDLADFMTGPGYAFQNEAAPECKAADTP
ncbi:alpha/beta fold hydrolase [Novosphingobium gossypii]|uniref:alpha/beta fold hydrolase n=1 Tax=Novosphingobium gossypii TaxID=1604774 RepID=UPI003D1DA299